MEKEVDEQMRSKMSLSSYLLRHDFLSSLSTSCCCHDERTLPFGIYFYLCCFIYRPSAHKTPSTLKEMDGQELIAYAILLSYFLLIFLSFGLVFRSLVAGIQLDKLFNGRAFFFLRSSIGALLCTWYCELYVTGFSTDFLCPVMIQFMNVRDKRAPIRDNN